MNEPTNTALSIELHELGAAIHANKLAKGWAVTTPDVWLNPALVNQVPADLALIHSEVSEALEAYRKGDRDGFAEEMADVFIRVLGLTHGLGVDLGAEAEAKVAKNDTRPIKHGGKKL